MTDGRRALVEIKKPLMVVALRRVAVVLVADY
jgi:hypothetical protein